MFLRSNDKVKLEKALAWSEIAVGTKQLTGGTLGSYLDTKANLLYKLGKTEDAISIETKAVKASPEDDEIKGNLEKMKEGKHTW
jgi:hypothetical protein